MVPNGTTSANANTAGSLESVGRRAKMKNNVGIMSVGMGDANRSVFHTLVAMFGRVCQ